MLKRRKILVTTGTRAEYGILRPVLKKIHESKKLDLLLVVTGTHNSKKYGMTINEIKKDGFNYLVGSNGKLIANDYSVPDIPFIFGDLDLNEFLNFKNVKFSKFKNVKFTNFKNFIFSKYQNCKIF